MIIAALDIATQTGVAVGQSSGDPRSWSVDLGKTLSHPERFAKVLHLAADIVSNVRPDLVVVEAATGQSMYLTGLVSCVEGVCADRGVRTKRADIGTVRKHFLGRHYIKRDFPGLSKAKAGKAIKQLVIDRCRLLKWEVEDDNAADACAIWDWARATYANAQSAPLGALFNGGKA